MDAGSLLSAHPITDSRVSSLHEKKYPGHLVDTCLPGRLGPGSALTRRPG